MKITIISDRTDTVIKVILNQKPNLNFNQIKSALRKKDVRINNIKINENKVINKGDTIDLFLPNKQEKTIPIIYEDENIIIVNKPQGIETTKKDKAFTESESLEELFNAFACHRIDKNTEGLVILAKTNFILKQMISGFKNDAIRKYYQTIVYGKIKKQSDKLISYLVKDSLKSIVKIYDKEVENSVEIKTNYNVIETKENLSLLNVELLTGKTHQIRAHLAHIGLYVLGDEKYGKKEVNKEYKVKKQLLCAYKLKFDFEKTNKMAYLNNKTFEIIPSFNLEQLN